jgi:hypothetical protein
MDLHGATLEPAAAARSKVRRLPCFRDAQHALIEGTRLGFLPHWHGQLDVIERNDSHV